MVPLVVRFVRYDAPPVASKFTGSFRNEPSDEWADYCFGSWPNKYDCCYLTIGGELHVQHATLKVLNVKPIFYIKCQLQTRRMVDPPAPALHPIQQRSDLELLLLYFRQQQRLKLFSRSLTLTFWRLLDAIYRENCSCESNSSSTISVSLCCERLVRPV